MFVTQKDAKDFKNVSCRLAYGSAFSGFAAAMLQCRKKKIAWVIESVCDLTKHKMRASKLRLVE